MNVLQQLGIDGQPDPSAAVLIPTAPFPGELRKSLCGFLSRGNAGFSRFLEDRPQFVRREFPSRSQPDLILPRVAELLGAVLIDGFVGVVYQLPRILEIVVGSLSVVSTFTVIPTLANRPTKSSVIQPSAWTMQPRWAPENRPYMGTSKPAIGGQSGQTIYSSDGVVG